MSSDIRALISRMADELDHYRQLLGDDRREVHALAAEARAALAAEPVGEGPTTAELMSLSAACNSPSVFARAILARWGRPAAPPAPVGEMPEPTCEQISQWINANPLLRPESTGGPAIRVGTDWPAAFGDAVRWGAQFRPAPVVPVAIPGEQWHEDDGACLWWRFPIEEPPWSGDPREDDWPGHHTHFTRIVCPLPQAGEGEG